MELGIFQEEARQGIDQVTAFAETFALVDAAEARGLDSVWLGEIHFLPARSVISAPLLVATAIAARTRRLRVGTAVHLIPLNNPLRIAEEVATLDQISHGRVDFGVGRSGSPRAYDCYGIPYGESQARFREALEIIRHAWRGERFSYAGEFFKFDNATVAPRPYQTPHPPILMAATSEETFPLVARLGLGILVGLRGMHISVLREHLRRYRETWRAAGHDGAGRVCLRIPLYAAPTEREALDDPRESIMYYFRRQAEITRAPEGRAGALPAERLRARAEQLDTLSYDEVLRERVVFGTAPSIIDRLTELREDLGLDGVVFELGSGGLIPAERELRSLHIVADEVAPAFR
jgi:alkanesulfonate monooxygenase SsuD/methylene tetrahydromethanopterin reductase-like flavin-dependent oxidoreductase (luciferase family)